MEKNEYDPLSGTTHFSMSSVNSSIMQSRGPLILKVMSLISAFACSFDGTNYFSIVPLRSVGDIGISSFPFSRAI